jgi:transposase-like protein
MSIQAERRQTWEARIAAYRASGQKATEWCAAHQVNRRQLYSWIRRLNNEQPAGKQASAWMAVEVDKQPKETTPTLCVKVGPTAIEVRPGYNPALLIDVIRTLQALC